MGKIASLIAAVGGTAVPPRDFMMHPLPEPPDGEATVESTIQAFKLALGVT